MSRSIEVSSSRKRPRCGISRIGNKEGVLGRFWKPCNLHRFMALVGLLISSKFVSAFDMKPMATSRHLVSTYSERRTTHVRRLSASLVAIEEGKEAAPSSLPPWLQVAKKDSDGSKALVEEELQWLEWELSERHGWSSEEVQGLVQTLWTTFGGNSEWMLGCLDFMETLLRLEELATPAILLATAVHYVECLVVRQDGVYPAVRAQLLPSNQEKPVALDRNALQPRPLALPSSSTNKIEEDDIVDVEATDVLEKNDNSKSLQEQSKVAKNLDRRKLFSVPPSSLLNQNVTAATSFISGPLTEDVIHISKNASQIKRVEIVAEVVLPRNTDYEQIQNMLVSVSGDDWRPLAIRCVASLYRLEGILRSPNNFHRLTTCLATARSALYIYAPLAQRLGLHVLKTQLESKAFGILYPRQYKAALSLFERQGGSMRAVSQFLQQQVIQLLQRDRTLAGVDITVTTRVKEPYSFWKKLIRKSLGRGAGTGRSMVLRFDSDFTRRELASVLAVRDGVALRVILNSRDQGESTEERRDNEQLFCYHVHQLIRAVFPESHPSRVKDYIQDPKPNGYQSLHHTSAIRYQGLEIPFEVQIRSLEMHQIAEFGVAAHWDYKQHQTLAGQVLPVGEENSPPALPPADPTSLVANTDAKPIHTNVLVTSTKSSGLDEDEHGGPISSQSRIDPYLQALERARQSLVESSVFLFLAGSSMEHGQLISVQKGQRIRDVGAKCIPDIFSKDDSVDSSAWQVWRNGRLASWEEAVENGDVLMFQPCNGGDQSRMKDMPGQKRGEALAMILAE